MAVTDADVQMLWLSTINTSGDVLHMNESCHTCEWVISLHHTATHTATLCNSACAMGGCTRTLALDCCALQYTATLTATHRITLQHSLHHTATRCNTLQHSLQHTATHCNTLQHTATNWKTTSQSNEISMSVLSHTLTATYTATHFNSLQHTVQRPWGQLAHLTEYVWVYPHTHPTHYDSLQHTLQHTPSYCNIHCHTPEDN